MSQIKRSRVFACASALLTLSLLSCPARAQDAAQTADSADKDATVMAAESASGVTSLEGITVTSTKTAQTPSEAMAASSVVTGQELEQIQPDQISDILIGVPGVATQEDGDEPATAINIRGLQDFGRVNVMIEGARQNFQRSGHSANGQFYLEPDLVRAVDITRGPVANVYGSGAIGGVVNFELIDPSDILAPGQIWATRSRVRYDTNDEGLLLSQAGALQPTDTASMLANVTWREDNSYTSGDGSLVPLTGEQINTALLKGVFEPAPGHQIKLTYLQQENDYITRTYDDVPHFQRDSNTTDKTAVAQWTFDDPSSDLINWTASTYYTDTETRQKRIAIPEPCVPPAAGGSCSAVLGNIRNFRIQTAGFDAYNTSEFDTWKISHAVSYGGDLFKDEVMTRDPAGTGDVFTPGGDRTVYGAFVEDQLDILGYLQVIGALRYDAYDLAPAQGPSTNDGDRLSKKLTVGVTPVEGVQFFASYAQGYRAPALTETFNSGTHDVAFPFGFLENPDLQPETAENNEYGVNLNFNDTLFDGDRFWGKAVYFQNTIANYIDGVIFVSALGAGPPPFFFSVLDCPATPPIPLCFQYQNIRSAYIYGVELESNYDAGFMFARMAYSRIRGEDEELHVPLLSVYPDKLATTLGFRFLDETLTLGGRWTKIRKQNQIPPETRTGGVITASEGYNVIDLFALYDFNEKLSLSLNLNNVTDEDYTVYREFDPAMGFNASLGATIKLGG